MVTSRIWFTMINQKTNHWTNYSHNTKFISCPKKASGSCLYQLLLISKKQQLHENSQSQCSIHLCVPKWVGKWLAWHWSWGRHKLRLTRKAYMVALKLNPSATTSTRATIARANMFHQTVSPKWCFQQRSDADPALAHSDHQTRFSSGDSTSRLREMLILLSEASVEGTTLVGVVVISTDRSQARLLLGLSHLFVPTIKH
jgi:hypothetical protein